MIKKRKTKSRKKNIVQKKKGSLTKSNKKGKKEKEKLMLQSNVNLHYRYGNKKKKKRYQQYIFYESVKEAEKKTRKVFK